MIKVFLHYEGSQGPQFTKSFMLSLGETPDDVLSGFVVEYNKHHENIHSIGKGKLDPLCLSLRRAEDRRPFAFTISSSEFLEELEDREDLLVEDLVVPRKAPTTDTSTTATKKITGKEKEKEKDREVKGSTPTATTTVKSKPPPPDDHPEIKRAVLLLKDRKYRQCRELLLSLKKLASYKKCIPLLTTLCKCYIEMKEYKKAVKCAEELLEVDSDGPDGYFYKSIAHKKLQESKTALQGFARTIEILTKSLSKKVVSQKDIQNQLFDAVAFQIDCLMETGSHHQAGTTLNESMGITGIDENINFLISYTHIALAYNKIEEGTRCLLKAIVVDQTNKRARELTVILLKMENGFEEVKRQLKPSTESAAAYALFATFAKDVSELELSAQLYEFSMQLLMQGNLELQRLGASYALNLAHVYEAMYDLDGVFECIIKFLKDNPRLRVGRKNDGFTCAELYESTRLSELSDSGIKWCKDDDGYMEFSDQSSSSSVTNEEYDANSLDLLALGFTLVKILYAQGKMSLLLSLFRVIERTRKRSAIALHETHIRNENAYYCCIAQIMAEKSSSGEEVDTRMNVFADIEIKENSDKTIVEVEGRRNIYVCGDSHVMPLSWTEVKIGHISDKALLIPKLVTGVKQWHLRPESNFYPKANFLNAIKSIPTGAEVILIIGEIDCREGIFKAIEKGYYDSVEDGIKRTVDVFISLLKEIIEKRSFKVYIHPILPVLNETRGMVKLFNTIYKSKIDKMAGVKWLDFFDDLLTPDGSMLKPEFHLDGTHISPKYISLLQNKLI